MLDNMDGHKHATVVLRGNAHVSEVIGAVTGCVGWVIFLISPCWRERRDHLALNAEELRLNHCQATCTVYRRTSHSGFNALHPTLIRQQPAGFMQAAESLSPLI
jgi:hypothetical protein